MLSTADAKSPRAARGSEKLLVLEPASRMVAVEPVLLTPGVHLIGSGADCTTVVSAQGVQEKHCEITVSDRRATLKAFDRRTWLNAGPVVESSLRIGDRLILGPVEFTVSAFEEKRSATNDALSSPRPVADRGELAPAAEETKPTSQPVARALPNESNASAVRPVESIPPRDSVTSSREPSAPSAQRIRADLSHEVSLSAEATLDSTESLLNRLLAEEHGDESPELECDFFERPQSDDRRPLLLDDLLESVGTHSETLDRQADRLAAREWAVLVRERAVTEAEAALSAERRRIEAFERPPSGSDETATPGPNLDSGASQQVSAPLQREVDATNREIERRQQALDEREKRLNESLALLETQREEWLKQSDAAKETAAKEEAEWRAVESAGRQGLQLAQEEVERVRSELAQALRDVDAARASQQEKETELSQRQGALEDWQSRLSTERIALDASRTECETRQAELAKEDVPREADIAALAIERDRQAAEAARIGAESEELEAFRTRLTEEREELSQVRRRLDDESSELERRRHALAERERSLNHDQQQHAFWFERLSVEREEIERQHLATVAAHAQLEAAVRELQTERDTVRAELSRLTIAQHDVARWHQQFTQQQDEFERRRARVEDEWQAAEASLEGHARRENEEILRRQEELSARAAELNQLSAELAGRARQLTARTMELDAQDAELKQERAAFAQERSKDASDAAARTASESERLAQAEQEAECAQRSLALEQKERELAEFLASQEAAADAERAGLAAMRTELEAARQGLAEREVELNRQWDDLQRQAEEFQRQVESTRVEAATDDAPSFSLPRAPVDQGSAERFSRHEENEHDAEAEALEECGRSPVASHSSSPDDRNTEFERGADADEVEDSAPVDEPGLDEDHFARMEANALRARQMASFSGNSDGAAWSSDRGRESFARPTREEEADAPVDPGEADGEGDESVRALRSQLASMFHIPSRGRSSEPSSIERDERNESILDDDIDSAGEYEERFGDEEEEVVSAELDVQGLMESLQQKNEGQRETGRSDRAVEAPVNLTDIEDSASVAAYMEQLFARARRGGSPSDSPSVPPTSPAPVEPRSPQRRVEPVRESTPLAVEADESLNEAGEQEPRPVPKPVHRPDREAIRANLDSLREVANRDARNAIAKHSVKQLRSQARFRLLFAGVAFVFAIILLHPSLQGGLGLNGPGWSFAGLGVVILMEMLFASRNTLVRWWRTPKPSKSKKVSGDGLPEVGDSRGKSEHDFPSTMLADSTPLPATETRETTASVESGIPE